MTGRWMTKLAVLTVLVAVTLVGCTTISQWQARDTEQLLVAAGFTKQLAEGPESGQRPAEMTPYRLSSSTKDGAVVYAYADPAHCKCVYVGRAEQYAAYRRLARERDVAQQRRWASEDVTSWGWAPLW